MEKKVIGLLVIMLAIGYLADSIGSYGEASGQIEVTASLRRAKLQVLGIYFSPNGGCEDQILNWINNANSSIHILIYSFTLDVVSDALISSHQRGIEVEVVFEKQQITEYSEYQKLRAVGVPVRNDTNPDLMHDKIMIVDGIIVLTGSFNYSAAAEEGNNENLIVIKSMDVATTYEQEFQKIWNQSV